MSQMQKLRDLTIQLEVTEQELKTIGLENIEYQKEINELKQYNTDLTEENTSYFECAQLEQQEIVYLRSVSIGLNAVNSYNDDLNIQISEYQQMVKKLKTENEDLKKHNTKYKIILEKNCQEKERRNKMNNDNVSALQNKIKELENECDELREELNRLNTPYHDTNNADEKEYELNVSTSPKSPIFRLKHLNSMNQRKDNVNEDILSELLQFGYIEDDIMMAMNTVNNKHDINDIVECIESETHHQCDLDIGKLKYINNQNETKINKLQRKIKLLQRQNIINSRILKRENDSDCWIWSKKWFG